MAFDSTKPTTTDNYATQFVPNVQANFVALGQWLDSVQTTITGTPPTFSKRYNRTNTLLEEFNGTAWAELPVGYPKKDGTGASGIWPVSVTGNAATATNASQLGGQLPSFYQTALGFTPVQQGGGTGQGTNKVYIGWASTVLNLQVDATNYASTWPISVSGNAATATNAATASAVPFAGVSGKPTTVAGYGITDAPSVRGSFANLQASANGTTAAVVVTADELVVSNVANTYAVLRAVSLSINTAAAGANGLDTGTLAASTWYAVWVIFNGTTTAGLVSLSATAPTLPSGYTHKARVGWIRTDGTANKFPLAFQQKNRTVDYDPLPGSNLTQCPTAATGSNGGTSTSVSLASFVPPTAGSARILGGASSGINGNIFVSARSSAAIVNTACLYVGISGNANANASWASVVLVTLALWYSSTSAAGFFQVNGWEDNL